MNITPKEEFQALLAVASLAEITRPTAEFEDLRRQDTLLYEKSEAWGQAIDKADVHAVDTVAHSLYGPDSQTQRRAMAFSVGESSYAVLVITKGKPEEGLSAHFVDLGKDGAPRKIVSLRNADVAISEELFGPDAPGVFFAQAAKSEIDGSTPAATASSKRGPAL